MKLSGKTAIVTGSRRGIGKAIALNLGKEGCNMLISDVNMEGTEKTAAEIKALNQGKHVFIEKPMVLELKDEFKPALELLRTELQPYRAELVEPIETARTGNLSRPKTSGK